MYFHFIQVVYALRGHLENESPSIADLTQLLLTSSACEYHLKYDWLLKSLRTLSSAYRKIAECIAQLIVTSPEYKHEKDTELMYHIFYHLWAHYIYFDELVQERRNSIADALELCLSCTNPSICIDGLEQERCNSIANILELRLSCTNPSISCKKKVNVWIGVKNPRKQGSHGQYGAHLGPVGPRWAPCWPGELSYQGLLMYFFPCHSSPWRILCMKHSWKQMVSYNDGVMFDAIFLCLYLCPTIMIL